MTEYGELVDSHTVRFERVLPGPIERVWRYLTESELRSQWLCAGDVETRQGGRVDMQFHNVSLSTSDDIPRPERYRDRPERVSFTGSVTRCEAPRLLAHTWNFGEECSEVCYELFEEEDKVRLVLTHTRLDSGDLVLDVSGGWHTHLNLLGDILTGQPVRPFYRMQEQYLTEYRARLGHA